MKILILLFISLIVLSSVAAYEPCNCVQHARDTRNDIVQLTSGNAEYMDDNYAHQNRVLNTPAVGVLVVYDEGVSGASQLGHVGYVSEVHADGSFTLTERGWNSSPEYNPCIVHTRVDTWEEGVHFLYGPNDPLPDEDVPVLDTVIAPSIIQDSLPIEAYVSDESIIDWVQVHVQINGAGFVIYTMDGNNPWTKTIDTSSANDGSQIKYLFWARDEYGNSAQISGLYSATVNRDETNPQVSVLSPTNHELVKDTITIRAEATDNQEVTSVKYSIHYLEASDLTTKIRHPSSGKFDMVNVGGNTWEAQYNLYASDQRAIAQKDAYVSVVAYDDAGNWKRKDRFFDIKIGNREFLVDPSKEWPDMQTWWNDRFPMLKNSLLYIKAIKIDQFKAYSAPNQPQVPEGDGSVCLGTEYLMSDGSCKALVMQTWNQNNGVKQYYHIGGDGIVSAEVKAKGDGAFKLGMNDVLGQFSDNSGAWKVKMSIYPPETNSVSTTQVKIREKSDCKDNYCAHAELWVESFGTFKKLGDWYATSVWKTRTRNDPSYIVDNADAVWLLYDNDKPGRRYYVDFIKINGVPYYSTDQGVIYYRGTDTLPFELNNPAPGQQQLPKAGALRIPIN